MSPTNSWHYTYSVRVVLPAVTPIPIQAYLSHNNETLQKEVSYANFYQIFRIFALLRPITYHLSAASEFPQATASSFL